MIEDKKMTVHPKMFDRPKKAETETDSTTHKINAAFAQDNTPWEEGPLKQVLLDYVGGKHQPKDGDVTVEMIVDTMANEFPEFVMAVAEENWIRGYHQAINDIDRGQQLLQEHADKEENDTT